MIPSYLKSSLQKSRLLSEKEEIALALKIQQEKCVVSSKKLIEGNLKLVAKIAGKFQGCGLEIEDLIQEGNLGLIKAAERFDSTKGFKFSTYATWWIKQSILLALDEKGRTVRIPGWLLRIAGKVQKMEAQIVKELGRKATLEELSERLAIEPEKIILSQMIYQDNPSLDYSGIDEDQPFLEKFIYETESLDSSIFAEEMKQLLSSALKVLDKRELEILQARFDLNDSEESLTLQLIGEKLGITNERVRQIEKKALGKLKNKLERSV